MVKEGKGSGGRGEERDLELWGGEGRWLSGSGWAKSGLVCRSRASRSSAVML